MDTKIYSIFPACGKTWLYEHQDDYDLKILDSDSSKFSWLYVVDEEHEFKNRGKKNYVEKYVKVRNPEFPTITLNTLKKTLANVIVFL